MKTEQDLTTIYARAIEWHQSGELTKAIGAYKKILLCHSDADLVLYNLGLALYDDKQYMAAVESFTRAVEFNHNDPDYWFNLALAYKQMGNCNSAIGCYKKAAELSPQDADIFYNMGCCCQEGGFAEKAIKEYKTCLDIDENHLSALNNLAYLEHKRGNFSEAKRLYSRIIFLNPEHRSSSYMLKALSGEEVDAPPAEYVSQLFDAYSRSFEDDLLGKLGYKLPELILEILKSDHGLEGQSLAIVDLGCGTGLCGLALKDFCYNMVGVDISAGMTGEAEKKNIYDELVVAELVEFLQKYDKKTDIFVAADVLNYLGKLEAIFTRVSSLLSRGGAFIFSVELAGDDFSWQEEQKYILQKNGRYIHNPAYIESLLEQNSFTIISHKKERLRKEGANWVRGAIYLLSLTDR